VSLVLLVTRLGNVPEQVRRFYKPTPCGRWRLDVEPTAQEAALAAARRETELLKRRLRTLIGGMPNPNQRAGVKPTPPTQRHRHASDC
jgi:hypothetical protein